MKNFRKNWKTSLSALIATVLLVIGNLELITGEQSQVLAENLGLIVNNAEAIAIGVVAIGQVFSKDSDKDNVDENI